MKENCWRLHGKLQSRRKGNNNQNGQVGQQGGHVHMAQSEDCSRKEASNSKGSSGGRLNKEEIERLRSFLTSLEKPSASCSFARLGKYSNSHAFSASKDCFSSAWVINSSTNHMTNSSHWLIKEKLKC